MRDDFEEFSKRTGLPAIATKEELLEIGSRHLRSDSFELEGITHILEQMQYKKDGNMYMWKRLCPNGHASPFEIHVEANPTGCKYYPTKK